MKPANQAPKFESSYDGFLYGDIAHYIFPLVQFTREHYGKFEEVLAQFCETVFTVTDGQIQIALRSGLKEMTRPHDLPSEHIVLPVKYNDIRYADLYVTSNPDFPERPSLHIEICIEMARMCGWLIHLIYEGALVRRQSEHVVNVVVDDLSHRQLQVLALMAKGCQRETIAEILKISPTTVDSHRQSIYRRLGVHSVTEAVYAAHKAGMLLYSDA